jgi:hypothetical protein
MAQRKKNGESERKKKNGAGERKKKNGAGERKKKNGEGEVTRGTAPSAPDIRQLEKFEASEEAKQKEPSQVDARGMDKRRQVVGQSHGPSRKSQILFFVTVGLIIAVLVGGYALAIAAFDQPAESYPDEAPWSRADAARYDPGSPSEPCGEPGNPHPAEPGSPCLKGGIRAETGGGSPGGSAETQSGSSNQAEE